MSDEHGWLPDSWQVAKLDSVVLSVSYGHTASSTTEQVGPKFLRITDLQDGRVNWDAVPFCICSEVEVAKYQLKSGDIVIARTGATTGKSYLLDDPPFPSVFASYLIRLETLNDVLPKFLATFMQSSDYWGQISSVKKGMAQPGVNASVLKQLDIPIAPLNEQRRIVAKIEALQERSRKARETLSEVGPLLEQFRQSLLAAAFRGDLTADWRAEDPDVQPASELLARIRQERRERWEQAELAKYEAKGKKPPNGWKEKYQEPEPVDDSELPELPEGWCWASAEELTKPGRSIIYGIIKPGPDYPGGVPYVRVTEMKTGTIDVQSLKRCNPERAAKFVRAELMANDILISKDGTIGKVAIVPPELEGGNITQHLLRLSPSEHINSKFLARIIESPYCQHWMTGELKGIGLQGINVGDFRRMPLPVAPLVEQQLICSRVESAFTDALPQEAEVHQILADMAKLDQSFLAKAFRGELVPQDPNDEPASALLDRIREARAKHKEKTKGKKTTQSPKRNTALTKSRFDNDVQGKPYLAKLILASAGKPAMTPDELFQIAKLPLADFYKQLDFEVEQHLLFERDGRLEPANAT